MKVLPDGSLHLERGERVPFCCSCGHFIPYSTAPQIHCDACAKDWDAKELAKATVATVITPAHRA